MNEFTFTLKYLLAPEDADQDSLVERLGEQGCDDALVGIGVPGRIALEFTREAVDASRAMVSALADVKAAIPSARLMEAAPDFVGLTDVADAIGVSRQNMRKLMLSHAATFPAPVHEGSAVVWHMADILVWLDGRGSYEVEPSLMAVAAAAKQVNLAKESLQLSPGFGREIKALIS